MTDVLDAVRRADAVRRIAWSESPEGRAVRGVVVGTTPAPAARGRRRPSGSVLVAAAIVSALVAGVAVVASLRGQGGSPDQRVAAPPTMRQLIHGSWRTLSAPMLAELPDPVSVWTGRELLIWSSTADRGVAFDPRSRGFTAIPPSGVVDGRTPMWVDGRMVVWAGATVAGSFEAPAPGVAYDPETRGWTPIASSPVRPRPDGGTIAVVAGDALVVMGADTTCPREANCDTTSRYVAEYRPTGDTWSLLPNWVQLDALPEWAGWDGQRIVAVSDQQTTWALEPGDDRWALLDLMPFRYAQAFALRFPDELVSVGMVTSSIPPGNAGPGVNWRAVGLAHDALAWSDIGSSFDAVVLGGAATRVGNVVVIVGQRPPGRSGALDVRRGRWRPMPAAPGPIVDGAGGVGTGGVAWTGNEIVGLIRRPDPSDAGVDSSYDLALYTPAG